MVSVQLITRNNTKNNKVFTVHQSSVSSLPACNPVSVDSAGVCSSVNACLVRPPFILFVCVSLHVCVCVCVFVCVFVCVYVCVVESGPVEITSLLRQR